MKAIYSFILFLACTLGQAQTVLEFPIDFQAKDTVRVDSRGFQLPSITTNFVKLSAFTYSTEHFVLLYRYKQNGKWSELKRFQTAHATEGQERKAFEGAFIYGKIDSVKFINVSEGEHRVVFRTYLAHKEKLEPLEEAKSIATSCTCPQPPICFRTCWCPDGSCPKDNTPTPTTVTHLIIHHSAGGGSAPDYAQVVESYWDLHVNTNGWDDIGYNWLIDPNGVVYEGRGSGIRGAHFSCMNGNTTGICLIGNYSNSSPSDTAMASLKQLLAWESCDKSILLNDSSFHASSQLMLPHVSTHRDGNASTAPNSCATGTVCPGDSLYADFRLQSVVPAANLNCTQGVDLAEANLSNALQVFPNPSLKRLGLKYDHPFTTNAPYSISILDLSGKRVRHLDGNALSLEVEIDIKTLEPGHYLLQLRQENQLGNVSFIKH